MPYPDAVRRALADALTLVLPVDCAGCGVPDEVLCAACRAELRPEVAVDARGGVPLVHGLVFDGVAARVVRALKEDGRTGLARALAPSLAAAVAAIGAGAVLVPIPTSRASFRRRGYRVVELVARRAGLRVERRLRLVRQPRDQRGLDVDARRRNVAGSLVAQGVAGRDVVVLDDVVTTGATLDEAVRALAAAGARVVACVAIARTPRRSVLGRGRDVTEETDR